MVVDDNNPNRGVRRGEDRLALILQKQSLAIAQLTLEVAGLKGIPSQIQGVEYKVNHLTDITEKISDLNNTATKHKTILGLLGAAVLLLFPLLVTWNHQIRTELADLHKTTIQIKERQERYVPNPRTSIDTYPKHSPRNDGEITGLHRSNSLQYRTPLEKQSAEYELYSYWKISL